MGNVRARASPSGYTPSFTALFFKLKGKKPQGRSTGYIFRPIVENPFRKKRKKIKKVRRVKKK